MLDVGCLQRHVLREDTWEQSARQRGNELKERGFRSFSLVLNATSHHLEDATIRGSFCALIFFDLFLSMKALPIHYCSPHNVIIFFSWAYKSPNDVQWLYYYIWNGFSYYSCIKILKAIYLRKTLKTMSKSHTIYFSILN